MCCGPPSTAPSGERLAAVIVVSNRGPLSFHFDADGALEAVPGGGGLVSSLRPLLAGNGDATWASVTMGAADREAVAQDRMHDEHLRLLSVVVDDDTYRAAYDVVSNTTLWYVHHHLFDLPRRPRFDRYWRQAWAAYRSYNRSVADVLIASADPGEVILAQDYHLSLLGRMLAEARPDLRTVHFNHIPFADPTQFRALPDFAADEVLDGLSGYGACSFHARAWAESFRACYVSTGREPPPTFISSLSPDHEDLRRESSSAACAEAVRKLRAETGGRRLIVRTDRVEPSKNIVRGLLAFEELLLAHPEWQGEVTHVALAYPSRQGLADYRAYGAEVASVAERINHDLGRPDWTPIYLRMDDDRPRSLAALTISDVLLVNPVRDGLNLVAKEGPLLNTVDGVLALSREAGAWEELAGPALGLNPFDVTGTADVLHQALSISPDERTGRASQLRALVNSRTAADWLAEQLAGARAPGSG
jgi:trehalose 6-phosphate synthase